jgi:hypothetical protein
MFTGNLNENAAVSDQRTTASRLAGLIASLDRLGGLVFIEAGGSSKRNDIFWVSQRSLHKKCDL